MLSFPQEPGLTSLEHLLMLIPRFTKHCRSHPGWPAQVCKSCGIERHYMNTELIQPKISTTMKRTHALVPLWPLALDCAVSEPTCVVAILSDRGPPRSFPWEHLAVQFMSLPSSIWDANQVSIPDQGLTVLKRTVVGACCPDERAEAVRIMELAWLPISAQGPCKS